MENTTNFNLQKYQSGDYFNPLTVGNPNLDVIDATMKSNSNRAIGRATELVSQGVHAITLTDVDCKTFKFIATGNYSAGETFTVNGIQVNAYTPSGSALVSNAFVTGSVVIASLNEDGNAITVYVSGTSTSDNSLRLGGELPEYYAKQSDMTQAESDITNLQNQNGNTSIVGIGDGTTTGAISNLNNNKTGFPDFANAVLIADSNEVITGYRYTVENSGYIAFEPGGAGGASLTFTVNGYTLVASTYNISPIPVKAGDVIVVTYTSGLPSETRKFRFIPFR